MEAFSETPILYGDDAKALIRDVMRKPNPKVVERNRYLARMVRELKSEGKFINLNMDMKEVKK